MVLVEPVGPVAAFVTWNGPLVTPSRKMSGALGAGCSIVLRASEEVPACAFALGQIVYECGLPTGVLSVLAGEPVMMSSKLLESPVSVPLRYRFDRCWQVAVAASRRTHEASHHGVGRSWARVSFRGYRRSSFRQARGSR